MKLYVLRVLIFVLVYADICRCSPRDELMIDKLECIETCQLEQHRHCQHPPLTCGDCLSSFIVDSSGTCRPRVSSVPQDEVLGVLKKDSVATSAVGASGQSSEASRSADAPAPVVLAAQVRDNSASPTSSGTEQQQPVTPTDSLNEALLIAIVVTCSIALIIAIIIAIICSCRLHKITKATSEVDYPAYGATGPHQVHSAPRSTTGDRKMAQSAQMFHFQHQKQQMLEIEKSANGEFKAASDVSSEDEDDGHFTVYECPGLATTGEMEVQNPLYVEPVDGIGAPGAPIPINSHRRDIKK
jgi:hypothetical protein